MRDLLSWAGFVTSSLTQSAGQGMVLRPWEAFVHGAALVLLDGMGLGAGLSPVSVARLREACVAALAKQASPACKSCFDVYANNVNISNCSP